MALYPCGDRHMVDAEKTANAPQVCAFKVELNGALVHLVGVTTTVRLRREGVAAVPT
jgi:hypothetical protein